MPKNSKFQSILDFWKRTSTVAESDLVVDKTNRKRKSPPAAKSGTSTSKKQRTGAVPAQAVLQHEHASAPLAKALVAEKKKLQRAQSETTKLSTRNMVLRELLTTEETYEEGLRTVVKVYLVPLKRRGLLSEDEFKLIFGHLETLANFHTTALLVAIRDRLAENTVDGSLLPELKIGNVFIAYMNFFKMYRPYLSGHGQAIQLLDSCMATNPDFRSFMEEASQHPRLKNQDLKSYLITPAQRIPRYHLLLKEISKATPAGHPDKENLNTAIQSLHEMNEDLDNAIQESKDQMEVVRLQERFIPSQDPKIELVVPSRRFLGELKGLKYKKIPVDRPRSQLNEVCGSPITVLLFTDILVLASPLDGAKLLGISVLPLRRLLLLQEMDEPTLFLLGDATECLAGSLESLDEFKQAVNAQIIQVLKRCPPADRVYRAEIYYDDHGYPQAAAPTTEFVKRVSKQECKQQSEDLTKQLIAQLLKDNPELLTPTRKGPVSRLLSGFSPGRKTPNRARTPKTPKTPKTPRPKSMKYMFKENEENQSNGVSTPISSHNLKLKSVMTSGRREKSASKQVPKLV